MKSLLYLFFGFVFSALFLSGNLSRAAEARLVLPKSKVQILRATERQQNDTIRNLKNLHGITSDGIASLDKASKKRVDEAVSLLKEIIPSTLTMNKIEFLTFKTGATDFIFENKFNQKIFCSLSRDNMGNEKNPKFLIELSCIDKNLASRLLIMNWEQKTSVIENCVDEKSCKTPEPKSVAELAAESQANKINNLLAAIDSIQTDVQDLFKISMSQPKDFIVNRPLKLITNNGDVFFFTVELSSSSQILPCIISVAANTLACSTPDSGSAYSYLGIAIKPYYEVVNSL